jgi:hypothetical protein
VATDAFVGHSIGLTPKHGLAAQIVIGNSSFCCNGIKKSLHASACRGKYTVLNQPPEKTPPF